MALRAAHFGNLSGFCNTKQKDSWGLLLRVTFFPK